MKYAKKVVLVSRTCYEDSHASSLLDMIKQGVQLFCVTGEYCDAWEEAMDWMCIDPEVELGFVVTSRHPGEDVEEVMAFAREWKKEEIGEDVTLLEI
ncbi:MAG: hypothetical protein ACOC24_04270 [Desulfovibrionales bacterium]